MNYKNIFEGLLIDFLFYLFFELILYLSITLFYACRTCIAIGGLGSAPWLIKNAVNVPSSPSNNKR